jgi:hypothetical protein
MTVITMQQLIKKLENMPQMVIDAAMPDAAKAVDATLRETIMNQQDPYGAPWPGRDRGTKPVLVNAVDALTVTPVDRTIYMVIQGIEARHHSGSVRGSVQRPMIPFKKDMGGRRNKKQQKAGPPKGVPPRIMIAVREVFAAHFEAWKSEAPK